MTFAKSSSKHDPELGFMVGFADRDGLEISEREHPDAEARFAMQLLSHHGILMGTPAGEDTAGRAKIDIMPPQDLVIRAFDISQAFHTEARRRGCMLLLPTRDETKAKIAEQRETADREKAERRAAKEKVDA